MVCLWRSYRRMFVGGSTLVRDNVPLEVLQEDVCRR